MLIVLHLLLDLNLFQFFLFSLVFDLLFGFCFFVFFFDNSLDFFVKEVLYLLLHSLIITLQLCHLFALVFVFSFLFQKLFFMFSSVLFNETCHVIFLLFLFFFCQISLFLEIIKRFTEVLHVTFLGLQFLIQVVIVLKMALNFLVLLLDGAHLHLKFRTQLLADIFLHLASEGFELLRSSSFILKSRTVLILIVFNFGWIKVISVLAGVTLVLSMQFSTFRRPCWYSRHLRSSRSISVSLLSTLYATYRPPILQAF